MGNAKAMTVTIYTVAGICFMIFFAFAVSLYLRDDSGASFLSKFLFLAPCLKSRNKKKSKTKVHASRDGSEDAIMDVAKSQTLSLQFRPEKFKIMLTYVQILSLFRSNYAIKWPGLVRQMFRILASFNLDIVQLVALDCIYRSNYFFSLTVVCMVPIVAGIVLMLIHRAGFAVYASKLRKKPRYCVKTGKSVR